MADYLLLTISKRSGFCQGCHFCTEARRWHEWNLSSGHRMTYLAATTREIWRLPDNYFAAARKLFWWPPYNASGGRYIFFFGLDPPPPPMDFSKYTYQRTTFSDFLHYQEVWGDGQRVCPPLPPLTSPSLPLSPSSLFGAARAPHANFFLFLPPSLFFSHLPPPAPRLPPPTPSSTSSLPLFSLFSLPPPHLLPPSRLPCPPPKVFLYAHFKIFCLASLACYYESACSVTAVRRFCWLPRKYQGCSPFIYFLHMYRTTVLLTYWYIPVHSHLC